MAKKSIKGAKNTAKPKCCPGFGLMPILIIVLVWWKPAVTWSKIVITVAAALILLAVCKMHSCAIKEKLK